MPKKNEPVERKCAVSGEVKPTSLLIRFVLDPDGNVVADLKRTLPGRGVWLSAETNTVLAAEKASKKVFGRGFKTEAKVEPGLAHRVEKLLERSALQALSFARKAGELVTGFAKVEAALRRDNVIALVHATDASRDGMKKLAAVAAGQYQQTEVMKIIQLFDSDQLDLALGRSNVIHAALLEGQASENFVAHARQLERFRGLSEGHDEKCNA